MEAKLEFKGTGGELFKKLFVGALLLGITFGIYMPWFVVAMQKYIMDKTLIRRARGDIRLEFVGTGGGLFKIMLVGALLMPLTLGIYLPWFMVATNKFFKENTRGYSANAEYGLRSEMTGGRLLGTILLGYLLTMVTLGIYTPWLVVKLHKQFAETTKILENGQVIGKVAFLGSGGQLLGTWLLNALLTGVTFGIYMAWMQVNLRKFYMSNTELTLRGRAYRGSFNGTGGELFVTNLVGYLLIGVTFGIYAFWFMAKKIKFHTDHVTYGLAAGQAELAAPAPRMAIPAGV